MKPLLGLCILAALCVTISCTPKSTSVPVSAEGILVYAEGPVMMNGKAIEIGTLLTEGSTIATGSGNAEIVFGGKNIIRMGPDTSLTLTIATLDRILTVQTGTVTAVLRKLDKIAGGKLTVQTPAMVAGVRGTSFFVRVRPEQNETYFCTCNGRVDLTSSGNSVAIPVEATHHTASIFTGIAGSAGSVVVSSPGAGYDHGHNDASLETLAAKINEKMDWSRVE